MRVRQTIQPIRRLTGALARRAVDASRTASELERVNAIARTVQVRAELSGLRVLRPDIPRRLTRLSIQLRYRWEPSPEYRRRQGEMQTLNAGLARRSRTARRSPDHHDLPPIFTFVEDTDVAPARLNPLLDGEDMSGGPLPLLPHSPRAPKPRQRLSPTIQPRLPESEPNELVTRPLFPRNTGHGRRA